MATDTKSRAAAAWQPIRRPDTTTVIVERIKSLIESGAIQPGCKLPSERELSQMLGVSRPSLRQALKSLSMMGVLESRVADGNYIKLSPSSGLAESLHLSILFQKTSLTQVIEARKVVELELAAMAARTATPEQIQKLERIMGLQKVTTQSVEVFNEHDTSFHIAIAEAAGNEVLLAVSKMLQRIASAGRKRTAYRYDLNRTFGEHSELVKRIKAQDPEGAREAMRRHLDNVLTVVLASDVVDASEVEEREE
ncbi:MAG: FadR/GntR family transcriptional regulator [Acidobacteriota bacterium]